eukprot:SAG31_NODE_10514_length_1129_cov_8.307767_1_plen_55_part_10
MAAVPPRREEAFVPSAAQLRWQLLIFACMYMYSLVRVPRRRDIFEDVYGPGVQRL